MSFVLTVTLNAAIDTTLTVPALEPGGSYTSGDVLKLPGGKGLNVARTLQGLGVRVVATGFAGGPAADSITGGLDAERMAHTFLRIAGASRTCNAIVELESGRITEINEPGPAIAAIEAERFLDLFGEMVRGAVIVALSGSLPPGLPDDYYGTLIARARSAGVAVVVDTRGRALGPAVAARPLIAKPNASEVGEYLRREVRTPEQAMDAGRALREQGAAIAIITLGSDGAVLVGADGSWLARATVPRPVSAMGSGDAFTGGVIAGLWTAFEAGEMATIEEAPSRSHLLVRSLVLGTACGAANTLVLGAGRIALDALDELRAAAVVRQLA